MDCWIGSGMKVTAKAGYEMTKLEACHCENYEHYLEEVQEALPRSMTLVKDLNYLASLSRSGDRLKVLPLQTSSMSFVGFIDLQSQTPIESLCISRDSNLLPKKSVSKSL